MSPCGEDSMHPCGEKPFNKYFDHTLLKADSTEAEIRALVEEALQYDLAAVCVNGCHVKLVREMLNDHMGSHASIEDDASGASVDEPIRLACVVGFPLGAGSTDAKIHETEIAIADGADEIDMVMNIGAAREGRWDYVRNEIYNLAQTCHKSGARPALLKVIIETCLLSDDEIIKACRVCQAAGADFVKTSTGFSNGGATVHHVSLMKKTVGDSLAVKASGGIRTLSDAKAMISAGADRLGCSASAQILQEYENGVGK